MAASARRLAESHCPRDWDTPEHDRRGALFPLEPGAGLVHADVLARDLQPLLCRGDRPLQGGRAQGKCVGIIRRARRSKNGVAVGVHPWGRVGPLALGHPPRARPEWGGGRPSARTPVSEGSPPPISRSW